MDAVKPVYLLLICQGFYLGSVGQYWTIPSTITALIGSCVEIPCTYSTIGNLRSSPTVWYFYAITSYPEILNSEDSSSVREEYRGRTSLVPGEKSCTLRIDPVRRGDGNKYYYPGITRVKSINAYEKQSKSVNLIITDTMNVQLHGPGTMTEGEASTIRCSTDHTCGSSPPTIQWNKPGRVTEESVEITLGYWREESELTYIPSYVDDGSAVQCTVVYPNGQINEISETLNINFAPKNVTVTVIRMEEVMKGSDVTLQCNSFSKPDVSEYEWYKGKNKSKLPDRGREITVKNVTLNMEPYSCASINTVGRGESALMEIPVPYAATGVHITVKNEGEMTELTCDFLSSRPDVSHYTWMKDGSIFPNDTGKTMTLYNNDDTYGRYSCIAHNRAGDSSSEEIDVKPGSVDLPLVLGTVAGVFFLIFFVLLVFFCVRQNSKSVLPTPPIHGTIPAQIPYQKTISKEENEYGNILSNGHTRPLGPSVDVNVEENFAIYSNSEVIHPSNDVNYSIIYHKPHDKEQLISSKRSHVEVVEYATLKR
ncbi:B-cell receptor CD22-like [Hyla sarda]|uniref:B-cell receptor CD22-like n=1 Tax=Hyla sarda TaxID=327740 RepID=UPI0024C34718|nr:B-cell receptor CD22-like [Hyla sarda]XP_056400853.1 B-cell receptor CD22-like [Hyla sarda]